jgi:hypothetical protein
MSTPLRDLITSLSVDSASQAAFAANPGRFLAEHGWADLDGQDVGTAVSALADEAPIDQAVRLSELVNDGFDGDAAAGLEAAAAALADEPVNGDSDVLELADPDLALDRPDNGIDDESDIDDETDIDDIDDGPDGPDRLDVADDELDTSTFRAIDDYEGDGQEAAEPAADAQNDTDTGDQVHDAPDVPLGDPTGGIDQGAGHESFINSLIDTDDDGDAVVVPEPEDDDL